MTHLELTRRAFVVTTAAAAGGLMLGVASARAAINAQPWMSPTDKDGVDTLTVEAEARSRDGTVKAIQTMRARLDQLTQFEAMAAEWWDPNGKFKPLHMLNPCRLDYIVDQVAAEFGRDPKADRPFRGLRLLDIGCGWASFVTFAHERYGCTSIGVTISGPQAAYAKARCAGMPITIVHADYRRINRRDHGRFDKVVSIGMFEHVGPKNYRTFMEVVADVLTEDGLVLLQTVGDPISRMRCDPWLDKYIFPNGVAPSIQQLGRAVEGLFVVEDWHNFGPDYYTTLMSWNDNLKKRFPTLSLDIPEPPERFYRKWEYFFTSFASAFKMRRLQLWQIVMSRGTLPAYNSVR